MLLSFLMAMGASARSTVKRAEAPIAIKKERSMPKLQLYRGDPERGS